MKRLHRHTILVLDDEPSILSSIQRLLRKDYEVLVASTVNEALGLLETCDVHLVMSDQRMPTMSGVEFLTFVKNCYPSCVRILFTGYTDSQSAVEAINSGQVYCYITKPWDPDEIRLMIAQAAERYDLLKERVQLLDELKEANESLARRNQELQIANLRLKDLDRLKTVFMEVISHELNTPTAIIQGYSQYLQREANARGLTSLQAPLQKIQKNATRLEKIINRVFQVLESNAPRVELRREETCLCEVLDHIQQLTAPFLKKRQQTLVIDCPGDIIAPLERQKVIDALLHLVMNAIKFSPDGNAIHVKAQKTPDHIKVQVIDQGMGINMEDRAQIFRPFFGTFDSKHHSSGEYEFGKRGMGLGLVIVQKFVEMHGGKVSYMPNDPQGSVFTVLLPHAPMIFHDLPT